ncbi:MAG: WD40 repeat domain-containing protein [Polyangiaceae bacterium]
MLVTAGACGAAPAGSAHPGSVSALPSGATSAASIASPRLVSQRTGDGLPDRCGGAGDGAARSGTGDPEKHLDAWCHELPPGAIARLGSVGGEVGNHVAVSSDGAHWVTASTFADVCFWSAGTGLMDRCAEAVEPASKSAGNQVVGVAFVKGDQLVAVLGSEELLLIDATTGRLHARATFQAAGERPSDGSYSEYDRTSFRAKSLAARGDRMAIGVCSEATAQVVRILDTDGKPVASYEVPPARDREVCADAVAFSPDGKILAAARGSLVIAWDGRGEILHTLDTGDTSVGALAFRSDGAELAIGGWGDAINAVSTSTWRVTQSFGFVPGSHSGTESLGWSSDGRFLAATQGTTARLWDATSSTQVFAVENVSTSQFDAMGELLTLGFRGARTLGRYAVPTGERLPPFDLSRHTGDVRGVSFDPIGKLVATVASDGVRTWERETGRPERFFLAPEDATFVAVAFVRDGALLAVTSDARLHVVPSGADAGDSPVALGLIAGTEDDRVIGVAASPAGDVVAVTLDDGTLRRWDVAARGELPPVRIFDSLAETGRRLSAPSWSRDGATIAVGSGGEAWLVDAKSGAVKQRIALLERELVAGVAFAPDKDLLAILGDRRVVVADVGGPPKLVQSIERDDNANAMIGFAAGGARLVLADRTVRVFDVASGKRVTELAAPLGYNARLAFSGGTAAIALDDGTTLLFDVLQAGARTR